MKLILVSTLVLAGLVPASGSAQDTVRVPRRIDRPARRDTVQFAADSISWRMIRDSVRYEPRKGTMIGDSVRYTPRDSVRWSLPKDSVRWVFADARPDTARAQGSLKGLALAEYGTTKAAVLQTQNGNTFAQHLFPPELVMQHQSRLKLTEQQRAAIVQEISRLQATAVNVQWRVADESEKLSDLLSRDSVAETAALEQVNKVIEYETAVKRAQLSMLIRIRNVLTTEQRAILRELLRPPR